MRRFPIFATIVVLAAVGTMIALGIWQLRRAEWKEGLLRTYQAAEGAPLLEGLPAGAAVDSVAFRRAHIRCRLATAATQLGGPNSAGQPGFRNIAGCELADGRRIAIDLGQNGVGVKPVLPPQGEWLDAVGRLIPDEVQAQRPWGEVRVTPLLFVMQTPAAGLQPSIPPSIENIPNNHRGYAVQWFLFAAVASIIYVLAVLRRRRA